MESLRVKVSDINDKGQILLTVKENPSRKFIVEVHWNKAFSLFSFWGSFKDESGFNVYEPFKALKSNDYHFDIDSDDFSHNETFLAFKNLYQYKSGIAP